MNQPTVYIVATIVVVVVFIVILRRVFAELDNAGSFAQAPQQPSKPASELDDFAAGELVRQISLLYAKFNAPDAEISAQLDALRQANSKQISAMLAKLLPQAEESIKKASGEQAAKEFYEQACAAYEHVSSR